jgi:hypothetical protein
MWTGKVARRNFHWTSRCPSSNMITIANFGIPMLSIQMPVMLIALLPVIWLEGWSVRSRLDLTARQALGGVAAANLVSTLIGIPVAWFVLMAVQQLAGPGFQGAMRYYGTDRNSPLWAAVDLLTQFAWIRPRKEDTFWMVPAASALLLVPSYLVSVWVERPLCRRWWKQLDPALVRPAVTHANRLSYAALFGFTCLWLGWGILRHG